MAVETATINDLIVKDAALHSGRPVIAGTGITVRAIAGLYKLGLNAEEIAGELPLQLAQVYAALAYYHLHTAEIEANIQADSEASLIEILDQNLESKLNPKSRFVKEQISGNT